MRSTRWLVALMLMAAAAHGPMTLAAQDSAARRDSAVARLTTGQQIRISGEAKNRLVGRAGVASNDSLDFAQDDAVRRIAIPAIDTLWVRGGSAKTGAIIGGAAVGLLGLAAYAAAAGTCESDCGADGVAVVGSFLLGATVGATLGAFIGARVQSWKRKYP